MRQVDSLRREFLPKWAAYPYWQVIPIVLCAVLLAVALVVFRTRLRALDVFSAFLIFGAAVLLVLIVLYTRSLRHAQEVQLDTVATGIGEAVGIPREPRRECRRQNGPEQVGGQFLQGELAARARALRGEHFAHDHFDVLLMREPDVFGGHPAKVMDVWAGCEPSHQRSGSV